MNNPLPECPDTPNCARISKPFPEAPEILFEASASVLNKMGAIEITENRKNLYIEAVFRIRLFGFKDDMQVRITRDGRSGVLHARSASRAGSSDFGVNKRRIRRFLKKLNYWLRSRTQ